jgi:hypothetical protein
LRIDGAAGAVARAQAGGDLPLEPAGGDRANAAAHERDSHEKDECLTLRRGGHAECYDRLVR